VIMGRGLDMEYDLGREAELCCWYGIRFGRLMLVLDRYPQ
jgi:hypothetical protein